MKKGYLSSYFEGVAAKRLSAVEANLVSSNQHEFNGINQLKKIFGKERTQFNSKFIYLNDNEEEPIVSEGFLTWYDAREKHPKRSEFRLYFPTTQISMCAAEGDFLLIGKRPDNTVLVIIAEKDSTIENQLCWLFGLSDLDHPGFSVQGELVSRQIKIDFASKLILEHIGLEIKDEDENFLDLMFERFPKVREGIFPTTREFSKFAQTTVKELSVHDNPDDVLSAWMEREEILFRTLEKHIVGDRLQTGFGTDVDTFFNFAISAMNRRKSRAGQALENHIEQILVDRNISYSRGQKTEEKNKPDFIFPNIQSYKSLQFDAQNLTMLAAKLTCKDRWRQILSEAGRIKNKHLLTLEPSISQHQINEMKTKGVQLVIPRSLFKSYKNEQISFLMNFTEFLDLVRRRQPK